MPIDIEKLQLELIRQNEDHAFSGVLAIRGPEGPILEQAYGWANRAERIPNTLDTRFGTASGAKTFTAVAIGQLVERGRLTFETLLKDCLDLPFPKFDPGITVHQLLTHSAGIPDYFDEEEMDDYEVLWKELPMYRIRSPRDFLPLFQDQPMKFAPGARWSYNNAGYIVLGLIVEQLSGMDFPDYIVENVFAPCGMADSGYFAMDRLPERTAYGYIETEDGEWRTNFYAVPIIGGPDGGAFTTPRDLAKFWDALLGHRLLNEATVARMFTPHLPRSGGGAYGYGLWISGVEGQTDLHFMLGEDPGAAFFSGVYLEKALQLTVMGNAVGSTWTLVDCATAAIREACSDH